MHHVLLCSHAAVYQEWMKWIRKYKEVHNAMELISCKRDANDAVKCNKLRQRCSSSTPFCASCNLATTSTLIFKKMKTQIEMQQKGTNTNTGLFTTIQFERGLVARCAVCSPKCTSVQLCSAGGASPSESCRLQETLQNWLWLQFTAALLRTTVMFTIWYCCDIYNDVYNDISVIIFTKNTL